MSIQTLNEDPDRSGNRDGFDRTVEVVRPAGTGTPPGGIYSLPVVGPAASRTRQFFDEMAPNEADSTEVRVAKEVLRWSSAAAGAAAVAVVVL